MGSAYARNLIEAGFAVVGTDVTQAALDDLASRGGTLAASAREVAEAADIILLALPSVKALEKVTAELVAGVRAGAVVCEMGTLPLEAKEACRTALAAVGVEVLDCPVSGTGAQAAVRDLAVYASGDEAAFRKVETAFKGFARDVRYAGAFGTGMKLKYIANLLVTIHNLSTAEALLLAERAGPRPQHGVRGHPLRRRQFAHVRGARALDDRRPLRAGDDEARHLCQGSRAHHRFRPRDALAHPADGGDACPSISPPWRKGAASRTPPRCSPC